MAKCFIIGGGFSAFIAKIIYPEAVVFTPANSVFALNIKSFRRRKNLEVNKYLGLNARSIGVSQFQGNFRLHDRLISGGNSSIWGGFIDVSVLPSGVIKAIEAMGINFVDIAKNKEPGYSVPDAYKQMRDESGEILNVSKLLKIDNDAYLHKISKTNYGLQFDFLYPDLQKGCRLESLRISPDDKVIIAVGVVQLIDLMLSSDILHDQDEITLDEYEMSLHIERSSKRRIVLNDSSSISYLPTVAISHWLGLRKKFEKLGFLNMLGLRLRQEFSLNKKHGVFKNNKGIFSSVNSDKNFGASIHYSNMCINKIPVAKICREFSPNLSVIGMASSIQKKPGPISNVIIELVLKDKGLI
jgi:hypothetical protein